MAARERKTEENVFEANHPFIQVLHGDMHMPAFNKFATQYRTNPSVRQAALVECSKDICEGHSLYQDASNEKTAAEFKTSLFRKLQRFTVPSAKALNDLEKLQEQFESETGQKRKRIDAADLDGLADQEDLLMDVGTRLVNQDMLESDDDDEEEGLIFADKKLYVRGKKKDRLTNVELGHKKLVAVVEEHKNNSASYQGGHSAIAEIAASISKCHASPVYVLTLAKEWKFAILHIRGLVRVRNGAIDPLSLPDFREQEQAMGFADDPIPDSELQSMFEMRTKFYRRYSDSPTSVYPDGLYPVGKYYVSDKWRQLPQDGLAGCVNPDVHLFYEGLLRIVIGDRVINWGDEQLQRVRKVRKLMRKEHLELKTTRVGLRDQSCSSNGDTVGIADFQVYLS